VLHMPQQGALYCLLRVGHLLFPNRKTEIPPKPVWLSVEVHKRWTSASAELQCSSTSFVLRSYLDLGLLIRGLCFVLGLGQTHKGGFATKSDELCLNFQ